MFKKPECHITFNEGKHRHRHKLRDSNKNSNRFPTFFSEDDVSGKFELIKPSDSNFDYSSITVELVGLVEIYKDPKSSIRFLSLSKDISKNGSLSNDTTSYNFLFKKVKLPYESYKGDTVGCRYIIKVNIIKTMRTISYEEEFVVVRPNDESVLKKDDEVITMSVGIKDLLSILIEFEHSNYGIHGTLKGYVSFGKVNMVLTKMEVELMKKETIFGREAKKKSEPKILASFELIDGGPYKNETIPFRFFLAPYKLTPSYTDVAGNFSVRYYLNLIVKDQNNNRFFKQKEIFLYRLYLKENKYSYNTLRKNSLSEAEQLKDFITEPFDFGDYFSQINDNNDENYKEPEPDDFYYKSSLTGYTKEEDEYNNSNTNDYDNDLYGNNVVYNNNVIYNNSVTYNNNHIYNNRNLMNNKNNSSYDIRKRGLPELSSPFVNTSLLNDNIKITTKIKEKKKDKDKEKEKGKEKEKAKEKAKEKEKKSNSAKPSAKPNSNKVNKPNKNNQVINIKEKNKYKNNDILINDNYYNTDNYVIYENSYHNVFDDKLKKSRIKYTSLKEKNSIEDEDEKVKEKEKEKDDINTSSKDGEDENTINTDSKKEKETDIVSSINDYNLYFPNEPFSNTLIMSNFPSNYGGIGQSGNFRQNLMTDRIKKKK